MVEQSKTLQVGVVGAGNIACGVHLPVLAALPGLRVAAVCDLAPQRAAEAAREFAIPHAYLSYYEMLEAEALDAVWVLTQPDQLFRPVYDCLCRGIDVFMEKPAGISLWQADALERAARERGAILQVGLNRRYVPLVARVLQRMRELTSIRHVEGCFYKHDTGSFYQGAESAFVCDAIHVADLMLHVAGAPPKKAATVQNMAEEGHAYAWQSVIEFENGVTGVLQANYRTGGRAHQFAFHGPEASAFINFGRGISACEATILHAGGRAQYSLSSQGEAAPDIEHLDGRAIAGSDDFARCFGFYAENEAFVAALRSRRPPGACIGDAVNTMRFVKLMLESVI